MITKLMENWDRYSIFKHDNITSALNNGLTTTFKKKSLYIIIWSAFHYL